MLDYTKLVAPNDHGGVLVEPCPSLCAQWARTNARNLSAAASIVNGRSIAEWRAELRSRFIHPVAGPIIALGHQPDLFHAGVWAKNIVAYRVAQSLGGKALNLVVDSDSPKQLSVRVPILDGKRLTTEVARIGGFRQGSAYEQIPPLTAGEITGAAAQFANLLGPDYEESLIPSFLGGMRADSGGSWVGQSLSGRRAVEAEFGIELEDLCISSAWWSPLAAHLVLRAGEFFDSYNQALSEYRVAHRVRGGSRPIPDLTRKADRIELPFWAFRDGEPRRRVFVDREGPQYSLWAGSTGIARISPREVESADDLIVHIKELGGWNIRPRALITTIWARLFLADLFIHGIGGAKYDRISNRIMELFFGVAPPEIACVTATLFLRPDWVHQPEPTSAAQILRDAEWNPQRHLGADERAHGAALLASREAVVQRSHELRNAAPADRRARHAGFLELRRIREQFHGMFPRIRASAQLRHLESVEIQSNQRIARDREYFFALHSRANLTLLMSRLPKSADFV